jgi:AcrR family transcriptional regulator
MIRESSATCPVRARGRRSDGERTRSVISTAAVALIAERGLAGTTQRMVAKRAGVSLAAVTYHFPALDDLVDAAFDRTIEESVAWLGGLRRSAQEGSLTLAQAWDAVVRDETGHTRAHIVASFELLVAATRQPRLRPIATRLLDALDVFFQSWTPGPDPARGVLSLLLGLSLTETASGRRLEQDAIDRVLVMFGLQPDGIACPRAAVGGTRTALRGR